MKARKHLPEVVEATLRRDIDALRTVVVSGAAVDETDADGRTALHHAAINGDVDATGLLLAAGARADVADRSGWTPLHFAARGHCLAVAEALLNSGVAVDAEDEHGNTPLFRAVFESKGRGEMIRLLRERGADVDHRNRHGRSPADLAATIANYDVKQWME